MIYSHSIHLQEFVTKHMYNPLKYFFDRKIAIPKGMLEDCHPFPMPTRGYLENPNAGATYALSRKKKVRKTMDEEIDYGNHNLEWEDGPTSWEEFGHANAPDVCGLPVLTVEEWEAGKYWEGNKPVLVKNVTDGWAALQNWKK